MACWCIKLSVRLRVCCRARQLHEGTTGADATCTSIGRRLESSSWGANSIWHTVAGNTRGACPHRVHLSDRGNPGDCGEFHTTPEAVIKSDARDIASNEYVSRNKAHTNDQSPRPMRTPTSNPSVLTLCAMDCQDIRGYASISTASRGRRGRRGRQGQENDWCRNMAQVLSPC